MTEFRTDPYEIPGATAQVVKLNQALQDAQQQRDQYMAALLDIADVLLQEDADTSGSWILNRIHQEVGHSNRVNP